MSIETTLLVVVLPFESVFERMGIVAQWIWLIYDSAKVHGGFADGEYVIGAFQ